MSAPFGADPDFMQRIRRIFIDGLPDRIERMRTALTAVTAAADRAAPPDAAALEELFLASHSLKGTAPGFEAYDVAQDAAALSELAREWTTETAPASEQLALARQLLDRIARGCREIAEGA